MNNLASKTNGPEVAQEMFLCSIDIGKHFVIVNLGLFPYPSFLTCILGAHWGGSSEYPRHMFGLRNKKNELQ